MLVKKVPTGLKSIDNIVLLSTEIVFTLYYKLVFDASLLKKRHAASITFMVTKII